MSLPVPLSAQQATDASRFGPKAANLAALGRAGLPIPEGVCLDADAYRRQLAALNLDGCARLAFSTDDVAEARRSALRVKLGLLEQPIAPEILTPLVDAWRDLVAQSGGAATVVRSSALVEDRFGSSFAGQFERDRRYEQLPEFRSNICGDDRAGSASSGADLYLQHLGRFGEYRQCRWTG